jgi:hypothetical protein
MGERDVFQILGEEMKYLLIALFIVSCQGPVGPQGPPGPAGEAGEPGVSPGVVKLCADDTSDYPEYALLVNGQLYAVYWGTTPVSGSNKQAFLALIVPGHYVSTGGNGCSFTVLADGSIQ